MRIGVLLLTCIAWAGCNGPQLTYAPDAGAAGAAGAADADAGNVCDVPKNSNSAPIGACLSAPKFVDCTLDGSSAGCLSNGADACTGLEGATCVSKCAANQYAVSCGGPATNGVTYDPVPANCKIVATAQNGKSYACCSCPDAN
jgi:hypothetical protein